MVVSSTWIILQIGMVSNLLLSNKWELVAGILMGGTVVGIAYQRASMRWKSIVIAVGMPLAYIALINIGVLVIVGELIILVVLASLLFVERKEVGGQSKDIEEKLKNCC